MVSVYDGIGNIYTLLTAFSDELAEFDNIIRGALSRILGAVLTDPQWAQASLPVAMGGLGLRSAVDHAAGAHAVSFLACQTLLVGLLGEDTEEPRLPQPLLDRIAAKTGEETSRGYKLQTQENSLQRKPVDNGEVISPWRIQTQEKLLVL